MTKEQFLLIFYGQRSIILGILIWLCIHYCRKGFFRFSFEKMIDCKGKQILEKKKHFLEMSVNILLLLMIPFVFFRVLLPAAKDLPYALKDQFIFFEGAAEEGSNIHSENKWEDYSISIKDAQGAVIRVVLYGKNGVDTGDFISAEYLPHSREGILLSRQRSKSSDPQSNVLSGQVDALPQPVRISIAVIWLLLFGILLFLGRKQRHMEKHHSHTSVILVQMPPILFGALSAFLWIFGIFGTLGMFGFVTQAFQTGADTLYAGLIDGCVLLFAYLRLYCRKKQLLIKGEYIRIETLFQKAAFHRDDVAYRFTGLDHDKIIFYQNGKKLTFVDPSYTGYEKLLCWLEKGKEREVFQ